MKTLQNRSISLINAYGSFCASLHIESSQVGDIIVFDSKDEMQSFVQNDIEKGCITSINEGGYSLLSYLYVRLWGANMDDMGIDIDPIKTKINRKKCDSGIDI